MKAVAECLQSAQNAIKHSKLLLFSFQASWHEIQSQVDASRATINASLTLLRSPTQGASE
jgi:DNA-binding response OmpR family regulator